jgi:predicted CoA-binding protein
MIQMQQAATEFLRARRIAVTGVSRTRQGHGGNTVFLGLRSRGFDVVPVNPAADEVEGVPCYRDLASIPGGVDAVVVATRADQSEGTVQECARLGIEKVWLHRSVGAGSASPEAARYGVDHGVQVINGGCPLMFGADADTGHKVMRVFCRLTGAVPRRV